jgi:predicted MFS family arabinose efflux permease
LAILGFAQLCSWGSLYYSFPLIAEAIGKDLGWSKTQLYGPATAGLVLAALAAYPVGVAIDRGYGRQLMAGGSLAVALLLAAWSQVHTVVMFSVIVAALGALQAATLYEAIFAVVARNATTVNIRSSITTLTLWAGFASTLFLPLVQWLLDAVDWRQVLLWLAFINVAVCGPSYHFAVQRGRPVQHEPARADAAASVKAAVKSAVFWWLATALTAYSVVFSAFTYHMYPMLLEQGLDTVDVVQAIAVIGPSQVAGRLLIGLFASRLPMRQIGVFTVSVFLIVFCLLASASTSSGAGCRPVCRLRCGQWDLYHRARTGRAGADG